MIILFVEEKAGQRSIRWIRVIGDGRCATPPVESTRTRSVRGKLKEIEEREEELSAWHTSDLSPDTV
jgi:hypothetical protein